MYEDCGVLIFQLGKACLENQHLKSWHFILTQIMMTDSREKYTVGFLPNVENHKWGDI